MDYLVCGACHKNFPLAGIVNFMQHKRFDCEDLPNNTGVAERVMLCQSCPQKFGTPWSLLQHAQKVHALRIYLENSDYSPGIMSTCISAAASQVPAEALFTAQSVAQMTQLIALQVQSNLQRQQNQVADQLKVPQRLNRGAIQEQSQGLTQGPSQGLVREPSQGLTQRPSQGLVREPSQGLTQGPSQGQIQEQSQGLTQGPSQGLVQEQSQGLTQGPSQGQIQEQSQGLTQGPSQGLVQEPSQGLTQGPSQGQIQEQSQGLTQGPSQGQIQEQSQGLTQGPSQGLVQEPSQGLTQGPSQGLVREPSQGLTQGPSQGQIQEQSQGLTQGPSQGLVQEPSQGLTQGPSQGQIQEQSQGLTQGPSQGLVQEPSQGLTQGPSQGLVQEPLQSPAKQLVLGQSGPMLGLAQGSLQGSLLGVTGHPVTSTAEPNITNGTGGVASQGPAGPPFGGGATSGGERWDGLGKIPQVFNTGNAAQLVEIHAQGSKFPRGSLQAVVAMPQAIADKPQGTVPQISAPRNRCSASAGILESSDFESTKGVQASQIKESPQVSLTCSNPPAVNAVVSIPRPSIAGQIQTGPLAMATSIPSGLFVQDSVNQALFTNVDPVLKSLKGTLPSEGTDTLVSRRSKIKGPVYKPVTAVVSSHAVTTVVTVSTSGSSVQSVSPAILRGSHESSLKLTTAVTSGLQPNLSPLHLTTSQPATGVTKALPGIHTFKLAPRLGMALLNTAVKSTEVQKLVPTQTSLVQPAVVHPQPILLQSPLLANPVNPKDAAVIPHKILPLMQVPVGSVPNQGSSTPEEQQKSPQLLQQVPFLASLSQKPVPGSIAVIKPTETRSKAPKSTQVRPTSRPAVTIVKGCCEDCSCLHSGNSAKSKGSGKVEEASKGPMIGLCCQDMVSPGPSVERGGWCGTEGDQTRGVTVQSCCSQGPADDGSELTEEGMLQTGSEKELSDATVGCSDVAVQADRCCREAATRSSARTSRARSASGDRKSSDDRCCDNQDCGVTIMPGTHEDLKKCCNAVVPKKRKRHMETKHLLHRSKKRTSEATAFTHTTTEGTIYIDFEPTSELTGGSSPSGLTVSTDESRGTITVNTNPASGSQTHGSAVVSQSPSSVTLSIPVSYTMRGSCPFQSGNQFGGPLKIPVQQARDHAQCCLTEGCPLRKQFLGTTKEKLKCGKSGHKTQPRKEQGDSKVKVTAVPPFGEGECNLVGCKSKDEVDAIEEAQTRDDKNQHLEIKEGEGYATRGSLEGGRGDSLVEASGGRLKKRRYPTSRPFKCDQCDNAFNQRIHLRKHLSKHTGIKPFKCEQCDYSTVERSHLKVHIRVHTGEKPFKCSHCEYATAQNSTLKIHLKRHHGNSDDVPGGCCALDGSDTADIESCPKSETCPEIPPAQGQEGSDVTESGGCKVVAGTVEAETERQQLETVSDNRVAEVQLPVQTTTSPASGQSQTVKAADDQEIPSENPENDTSIR